MIPFLAILVLVLSVIVAGLALYSAHKQLAQAEASHSFERIRWAEERASWTDERRWLNDRMIARHAGDVVAMDNAAARRTAPTEPREERERIGSMPEGLTG